MQLGHRSLLLGACSLLLVSGCDFSSPWGSSSTGSEYGSGAATSTTGSGGGSGTGSGGGAPTGVGGESGITGSNDSVVATASIAGIVSVVTGSTQTVSVTFTSSDGLAITGFGISASLGTLPSGWSGPTTFTCNLVSAGSGCVLNLTYAPTVVDSGTLTLNYIFVNNQNIPKAPGGSLSISYAATPNNNVVATASPTGQIEAAVGAGSQSVSVNFTTDDDNAATDLTLVTSLASLPSGWSSTATSFSCAIVSSGNGCQLMLTYAPTASSRGTLLLIYSYTDDSGAPQLGSVNIPYATSSANNVIATAAPAGEVIAIEKTGGQPVAVTFTTDDGQAATNLTLISNLRALPAGWSSSGGLTCGSVSTGNGCQLHLTYAPTALTSGTLALRYAYTDSSGTPQIGLLDVPYAATTNNNVVATPSQSGQVNAVVGMGSQAVSVTFTTDDGRLATALQLTSSLAALPAGWTSTDSSLACAAVSSGSSCQLSLMYTPTAAGTGTLTLSYAYKNNDGKPKTGTLNIPYRATTNDTIAGTPTQPSVAVITGNSTTVDIAFATDDGNPASALSVTSGLSALPAGWSSTSMSFSCSTVSAGTPCQLTLTYAPTAAAASTLNLGFSYTNDAGFAKTGTVTINYRATTNDTVAGLPSQSPLAVLTGSSTPVSITFTTDDGNPASGLVVTSGLSALPAGWSSSLGSFTCASVSVGTGCQLALTYAPTIAGSGTLTLGFMYTNNSGMAKTGTVALPYSATP
jgi:hypothetical protein